MRVRQVVEFIAANHSKCPGGLKHFLWFWLELKGFVQTGRSAQGCAAMMEHKPARGSSHGLPQNQSPLRTSLRCSCRLRSGKNCFDVIILFDHFSSLIIHSKLVFFFQYSRIQHFIIDATITAKLFSPQNINNIK